MNRVDTRHFPLDDQNPRGQFGALCWRMHRGHVQVLLITSRDTGRWVIPKGWPMENRSGAQAACQEAWEEAGVEGRCSRDLPIGYYSYDKVIRPGEVLPCMVTVYALRVARMRARFPERSERRRKWFDALRAARKVAEPELRQMLLAVAGDHAILTQPPAVGSDGTIASA